jgi:hypothetical protein
VAHHTTINEESQSLKKGSNEEVTRESLDTLLAQLTARSQPQRYECNPTKNVRNNGKGFRRVELSVEIRGHITGIYQQKSLFVGQ